MSDKYTVVTHAEYGYKHIFPIPSAEEVEAYYKSEFYSANYAQCNDSAQEKQEEDKAFNHGRYHDMLAIIENEIGSLQEKTLFDIGCGYGELLKFARDRGMSVAGLEVAPEAVDFLRQDKIAVVLSPIEGDLSSLCQENRYDVVTMLNVLEHLRNPALVLKNIREHLLAQNGILIIDVPNEFNPLQTAANSLFSLNEWWLAPPAHINYFTPTSLTDLLQACGYETFDMLASFPLELFLLMGDNYVGNSILGRQCHQKRVTFEMNMRKAGKDHELRDLYRSLAQSAMGRQVVCFAKADPFSVPVAAKQLEV